MRVLNLAIISQIWEFILSHQTIVQDQYPHSMKEDRMEVIQKESNQLDQNLNYITTVAAKCQAVEALDNLITTVTILTTITIE
jgi:hypothetical protein